MKTLRFMIIALLCTVAQGSWAQESVSYIERSWNAQTEQVVSTTKTWDAGTYTVLQGNHGGEELDLTGNYVVVGDVTYGRVFIVGDCNIILSDDCHLHTKGIAFGYQNFKTFNIFAQANDSGRLTSYDEDTYENAIPGIGHVNINSAGVLNIHGGIINAQGGRACPGIGTRRTCSDAVTNIFGGTITATGWSGSAGIGGGMECKHIGSINIYGGAITATGGDSWSSDSSAGIGGGEFNCPGTIRIYGGDILATGKKQGAGIGCGERDMDSDFGQDFKGRLTIEIHGGTVIAHGDEYAAGIGGGDSVGGHTVTISGGNVKAYGGTDAAGIGGGEGASGGTLTITGGEVYAEGKDYGAGIGGGEDGDGGKITITGGIVVAKAGSLEDGYRAIGAGKGSNNNGSLSIADNLMVRYGPKPETTYFAPGSYRAAYCANHPFARIERCTHPGASPSIIDGISHNTGCSRCTAITEAHTFGSNGQCNVCHLISLQDEGDNSAVFSAWTDDQPHSFVISGRKLSAAKDESGQWSNRAYTVCVPFDMDLVPYMDFMTLYALEYIKDSKEMVFTEKVPYLEAGKPYLMVMRQGELELLSRDVVLTDTPTEGNRVRDWDDHEKELGWWRGSLTRLDCAEASQQMAYVLHSDGTLRRITPESGASLKAFRGMYCPDAQPQTDIFTIHKAVLFPAGGDEVDYITDFDPAEFVGDADMTGTGTGVELVQGDHVPSSIFNLQCDDWYDLQGRRLSGKPSHAGVYINNGCKIVIK